MADDTGFCRAVVPPGTEKRGAAMARQLLGYEGGDAA